MVKGKKGLKNGFKPTIVLKNLSEDERDHAEKPLSSLDAQNTVAKAAEVPNTVFKTKVTT